MNQPAPPSQPVRQLPIAETIGAAYRSVLDNFAAWLQIMAGPALLAVAIAVIERSLFEAKLAEWVELDPESPEAIVALVQAVLLEIVLGDLIALIPYVFFAVAWHRFVLLGERSTFGFGALRPERRHLKFYLYVILLSIVVFLALGVVAGPVLLISKLLVGNSEVGMALIVASLIALLIVISLYVTVRLQFVFPALAVEEQYGFGDSWRNTRGQGWRLLFVLACCFLPPLFVGAVLSALFFGTASPSVLFFINQFVILAIGFLATAVCVSAISIAFRICTGWIPPPANQPPATV